MKRFPAVELPTKSRAGIQPYKLEKCVDISKHLSPVTSGETGWYHDESSSLSKRILLGTDELFCFKN